MWVEKAEVSTFCIEVSTFWTAVSTFCEAVSTFSNSIESCAGGYDASIGQRHKEKCAVRVENRLLRTLGVGSHNAVNAAAAPLHIVQAGEYIRDNLITPHGWNVPQIHVLNTATIGHAARRGNLHTVVEHFYVNFRAKHLIISVNQRIYQYLADSLVWIVAALLAGHAANAPRIFAVVADEILCILQQRNQAGTLIFFVIQRIGVDIAFVRDFPAGAEYARLRQYALVT